MDDTSMSYGHSENRQPVSRFLIFLSNPSQNVMPARRAPYAEAVEHPETKDGIVMTR